MQNDFHRNVFIFYLNFAQKKSAANILPRFPFCVKYFIEHNLKAFS